jgi:hypothetical protein
MIELIKISLMVALFTFILGWLISEYHYNKRKYKRFPRIIINKVGNAYYNPKHNVIVINYHPFLLPIIDNPEYWGIVLGHEAMHWVLRRDFGEEACRGIDYFLQYTYLKT